jgi:hypothetical protein
MATTLVYGGVACRAALTIARRVPSRSSLTYCGYGSVRSLSHTSPTTLLSSTAHPSRVIWYAVPSSLRRMSTGTPPSSSPSSPPSTTPLHHPLPSEHLTVNNTGSTTGTTSATPAGAGTPPISSSSVTTNVPHRLASEAFVAAVSTTPTSNATSPSVPLSSPVIPTPTQTPTIPTPSQIVVPSASATASTPPIVPMAAATAAAHLAASVGAIPSSGITNVVPPIIPTSTPHTTIPLPQQAAMSPPVVATTPTPATSIPNTIPISILSSPPVGVPSSPLGADHKHESVTTSSSNVEWGRQLPTWLKRLLEIIASMIKKFAAVLARGITATVAWIKSRFGVLGTALHAMVWTPMTASLRGNSCI